MRVWSRTRESLTSDVGEVGIAPPQVRRQHGHRPLVAQPAKREEGVGAAPLEPAPAQLVVTAPCPSSVEEGGPYRVDSSADRCVSHARRMSRRRGISNPISTCRSGPSFRDGGAQALGQVFHLAVMAPAAAPSHRHRHERQKEREDIQQRGTRREPPQSSERLLVDASEHDEPADEPDVGRCQRRQATCPRPPGRGRRRSVPSGVVPAREQHCLQATACERLRRRSPAPPGRLVVGLRRSPRVEQLSDHVVDRVQRRPAGALAERGRIRDSPAELFVPRAVCACVRHADGP